MQETQEILVRSLGWEDSLEEEMATHSSLLAWEIPWAEEPGGLQPWGCKESDTTETNTCAQCRSIKADQGSGLSSHSLGCNFVPRPGFLKPGTLGI